MDVDTNLPWHVQKTPSCVLVRQARPRILRGSEHFCFTTRTERMTTRSLVPFRSFSSSLQGAKTRPGDYSSPPLLHTPAPRFPLPARLFSLKVCSVCSSGYGSGAANQCHECSEGFKGGMFFLLSVALVLALAVVALLAVYLVRAAPLVCWVGGWVFCEPPTRAIYYYIYIMSHIYRSIIYIYYHKDI